MASINEIFASRSVTIDNGKPSVAREFHVIGVGSEQEALDALLPHPLCPGEIELAWKDSDGNERRYTLKRQKIEIREEATPGESSLDHIWRGKASYGIPESAGGDGVGDVTYTEPPAIRWQMDFSTEVATTKIAISQRQYGNYAPDCGHFINVVNRDGVNYAEGVSILVPAGILRGSKTYTASRWNEILSTAKHMIGKTNASAFSAGTMTFAAGELLFVGATVRELSDGNIDGEFQFLYSTDSSGDIDGISYRKAGWEYLWVYSCPELSSWNTQRAGAVFVATVYESVNFGNLFS